MMITKWEREKTMLHINNDNNNNINIKSTTSTMTTATITTTTTNSIWNKANKMYMFSSELVSLYFLTSWFINIFKEKKNYYEYFITLVPLALHSHNCTPFVLLVLFYPTLSLSVFTLKGNCVLNLFLNVPTRPPLQCM